MWAVEFRREERRRRPQNPVHPPELLDLLLQLANPGLVRRRSAAVLASDQTLGEIGIMHPLADRLDPEPELLTDSFHRAEALTEPKPSPVSTRRNLTRRTACSFCSDEYRRDLLLFDFDMISP